MTEEIANQQQERATSSRSIHEQAERIRRAEAVEEPCTHYGINEPRVRVCLDCYDAAIAAAEQRSLERAARERDAIWREALQAYGIQLSPRGWLVVQVNGTDHAPLRALLSGNASESEPSKAVPQIIRVPSMTTEREEGAKSGAPTAQSPENECDCAPDGVGKQWDCAFDFGPASRPCACVCHAADPRFHPARYVEERASQEAPPDPYARVLELEKEKLELIQALRAAADEICAWHCEWARRGDHTEECRSRRAVLERNAPQAPPSPSAAATEEAK